MSSINIPSLSNCINSSPPVMRKMRLYPIEGHSIIFSQSKVYFSRKTISNRYSVLLHGKLFHKNQLRTYYSVILRILLTKEMPNQNSTLKKITVFLSLFFPYCCNLSKLLLICEIKITLSCFTKNLQGLKPQVLCMTA